MPCKYCGERDSLKLIWSSRAINGRVETIEICFPCYWLDKFRSEGENGILPKGNAAAIFDESDFLKLLRRFNSGGKG